MTIKHGDAIRQLCDEFISGNTPRFIFGRTRYAHSIAEHFRPDGVIDDFTTETLFHGLPVVKLSAVPKNAIVVSAIVDGRPVSVDRTLSNAGIRHIDYFSFKNNIAVKLENFAFVDSVDFCADYERNRKKYDFVFSRLADDISRETFSRLVEFRLHEDLRVMDYFKFCPKDSYFESFVPMISNEAIFIDAGCYDGETTLEFIRHCPNYRYIHVFEPEPQQMALIRQKLNGLKNIHYHQCGASNKKETLAFTLSGSWSHLDEHGDIVVEVDTIDASVNDEVTFIKMDIEGHEYFALEGARETIIKNHPVLAICAYHKVDDFWKLPELIFSFRSDYQLYMRHYTEGVLETVYYFIPIK